MRTDPEDPSIPAFLALIFLLFAFALGACGTTPETSEPPSAGAALDPDTPSEDAGEPAFLNENGLAYTVAFEGAGEAGLEETMRAASQLIALQERPPATLNALRRRAVEDVARMTDVLRSKGYYKGTVEARVSDTGENAEVVLAVAPGDIYLIGDVRIAYGEGPPPEELRPDIEDVGIVLGMYAEADTVIGGEKKLVRHFAEHGYPRAQIADRRVTVNHDTQLMEVDLILTTGPFVTLGEVRFEGAETVRETYLRKLVPWTVGDAYKASTLEAYRRTLRESGLFGSVTATVDTGAASATGRVERAPVMVTLTEAAKRSIGAGADYSTSEGPGLKAFWEHRNIFGEAETLRLTAEGSELEQSVAASFRKPEFIAHNQDFVALAEFGREDTDAYESLGFTARMGLERHSGRYWTTGYSATAELSDVTDDQGEKISKLFGLPLFIRRDSSDSALDPTEGSRAGLYATPYIGHADQPLLFAVLEAQASTYHSLDDDGDVVLAARTRFGSIVGEDRTDLPADKRFFAGGGGSIRGYAFQIAGPLEVDNDPEGGLSVVEFGTEARFRLTEDIGVVPFIDGGAAQKEVYPTSFDDILWSGGLGVRYYTPIGPLRLDVAFPINGREGVDDSYQFYISIGQAF